MVATILAVNRIGVEGGGEIRNRRGEIFIARSCHITTKIFEVLRESLPVRFFRKKKTGGNSWGGPPTEVTTGNFGSL